MMERWQRHTRKTLNRVDEKDAEDFLMTSQQAKKHQVVPEYAHSNYQKLRAMESEDAGKRLNYFDPYQS